jgi:ribosomal protein S18 acetylase RimI-like enzyme
MLKFVKINALDTSLLEQFLASAGDSLSTFRYFQKRELNVLQNHYCTYLLLENNIPACYGHLDKEDGITWLGIASASKYKRKGYGAKMMEKLIDDARRLQIKEIFLTVDKDNNMAINLYEKFGFIRIKEDVTTYKYRLNII